MPQFAPGTNRIVRAHTASPDGFVVLRVADGVYSFVRRELSVPKRASHLTTIALFDEYVHEAPTFRAVFPDVTFDDTLISEADVRRPRTIELRYYGRGNTALARPTGRR